MAMNNLRIELLSKNNFDTWSMQVETLLIKNDLWDYVNGTNVKPEEDGETKLAWLKADKKAKADLILAIQPSELKQVRGCETSHDVWVMLESTYASKGPARKATLLKQLILQKLDENGDVKDHISKFFDIVDKLENMQVPINGDLLSIMLLYSLPKTYENFRCAIECRDELPSAEILKVKIIEESEARQNSSSFDVTAMVADNKSKNKSKNYVKQNIKCFQCGKFGHKANVCKKKMQISTKDHKKSSNESFAAVKAVDSMSTSYNVTTKSVNNLWILDSGCTAHLCGDKNDFDSLNFTEQSTLNLASHACTDVKGKGQVNLPVKIKNNVSTIQLNDVLYVPDLRTNLVSIAKIVNKGYTVIFFKDHAFVNDKYGNVKLRADRIGDLFYVCLANNCAVAEVKDIDLLKWHYRLGHLNVKDIKKLIKDKLLPEINMSSINDIQNCAICAKGKMSALPFDKNHKVCKEPIHTIHSDVCGPFRVESLQKHRYFVTFIDEYSRWCQIYFLRKKSDVLQAFKIYHKWIENQTEKRIKVLQTDNGLEYLNSEFDTYLMEYGISRRTTIPYTPQQNGIAERYNRTIMDMTRCLLLQSGLSNNHWPEAVSAACYIRNRCPSSSLNGLTPYEKLFAERPTLNHIRSFGSKVVILDKDPTKSKLAARGIEGIFIGYPTTQKGYRVWLPNERKIIEARDVKFINEQFLTSIDNDKNVDILQDNYVECICSCNNDTVQKKNEISTVGEQQASEQSVRIRGRPRIDRSGKRGRPKKIYNVVPVAEEIIEDQDNSVHDVAEEIIEEDQDNNVYDVAEEIIEEDQDNSVYDVAEEIVEEDQDNFVVDTHNPIASLAEVNLKTALNSPDSEEWYEAIESEIASILKNDTWRIVKTNNKTVGCRFVLTNKYLPDGKLERRKARLVAKGYSQQYGVNYDQTFAPVARLETVRLMLALSAQLGLSIWQFDIVSAYLNGNLDEQVFMKVPDNLKEILIRIVKNRAYDHHIKCKAKEMILDLKRGGNSCQLQKALYGLKQAGRMWYAKLQTKLESIGLRPTKNEPCLFFGNFDNEFLIVLVYVDDLLVASRSKILVDNFKQQLLSDFGVKDLGIAKCCIGLEIVQNDSCIILKQEHYIKNLLTVYGMSECNVVSTPAEPSMHSHCMKNQPYTGELYRELIGSLMYLSVASRPDIANVVSRLAQFVNQPLMGHWMAAKRVLRYLAGTADKGLKFKRNDQPLLAYADSDWGGCSVDRRSYTGYVFLLSGAAISWKSQKQRTVALSSTEAEYISLAEAAKEAMGRLFNCSLSRSLF